MAWAKLYEPDYPALKLLFHIPNGGKRNPREAARFKKAGVKAGVPDLFLPVASKGYNGLFIELKRTMGASVSAAQTRWARDLQNQGYAVYICKGWIEASETILRYLK